MRSPTLAAHHVDLVIDPARQGAHAREVGAPLGWRLQAGVGELEEQHLAPHADVPVPGAAHRLQVGQARQEDVEREAVVGVEPIREERAEGHPFPMEGAPLLTDLGPRGGVVAIEPRVVAVIAVDRGGDGITLVLPGVEAGEERAQLGRVDATLDPRGHRRGERRAAGKHGERWLGDGAADAQQREQRGSTHMG
jgi:hypothetical protein